MRRGRRKKEGKGQGSRSSKAGGAPHRLKRSSAVMSSYRSHDSRSSCPKSAQAGSRPMAETRSAALSREPGANSASSAVSSGGGSSSATLASSAWGENGSHRAAEVGREPGADPGAEPSTGAVATLPALETSTDGVYGVRTSCTSSPTDCMVANVLRYSRQNPWTPASTGRPRGVRQPPASPPVLGLASSSVTCTSGEAESASAMVYPAQPPPTTTTSLGARVADIRGGAACGGTPGSRAGSMTRTASIAGDGQRRNRDRAGEACVVRRAYL
eukprot:scaffold19797_cov118-Isochrysis_galbana.AAC.1